MSIDTLVMYHFYEKDQTYIDNLCHFLAFGFVPHADYVLIVSGDLTINLPAHSRITVVHAANKNNDYGGYCEALKQVNLDAYEHFIFVNSSVRGPFLLPHIHRAWTDLFTSPLASDVGICGSSINILSPQSPYAQLYRSKYGGEGPVSHVQTMVFCLTRSVLKELLALGFFKEERTLSKDEVICEYELRLSQLVLGMGKNLACCLPEYNSIDYRKPHQDINLTSQQGDPVFQGSYLGRTLHPYEAVFIKTNRPLFTAAYLDLLAFSMLSHADQVAKDLASSIVELYLARIAQAGRSGARVGMQELQFSPEDVLHLVSVLSKQAPQFKPVLRQIIDEQ